jgi:hypothetical protein
MNLIELQKNPAAFRAALLIDTDAGPRPLGECMAGNDWQDADFKALDSGWQRAVIGSKHQATHQRGWFERGRGHSKSLDLGIMAAWALFASRRRLSGIGAAGDQDQARLLRDAIGRLLYANPWLGTLLECQAYRVVNKRTESTLEIIASDAATSYGLTPDFIIADELTHWQKRDLWDSLLSSAAKRSTCMLVVITNAGLMDDWQWKTREAVRTDSGWYFSRLDGPVASWITADRLQEQERLLPGIAYRRLWLNEWTTGGGDALTAEDIAAAFNSALRPLTEGEPGWDYVGGLDLGVSRDASAVCVLGVRRDHSAHGSIRLARTQVWRPARGSKVDLQAVEDAVGEMHVRFNLQACNFDPWQAQHMASRLQSSGISVNRDQLARVGRRWVQSARVPMVEVPQSGQHLQRMATVLIEAFNDRRVQLFEEADLRRDLTRLRIEERSYGFRLVAPRDEFGHGDLGTAFGLAMLAASELAARRKIVAGVVSDTKPGESSWQRAMRQHEERAIEHVEHLRMLGAGGADYRGRETISKFMRSLRNF